jgi:hypothetical protein
VGRRGEEEVFKIGDRGVGRRRGREGGREASELARAGKDSWRKWRLVGEGGGCCRVFYVCARSLGGLMICGPPTPVIAGIRRGFCVRKKKPEQFLMPTRKLIIVVLCSSKIHDQSITTFYLAMSESSSKLSNFQKKMSI